MAEFYFEYNFIILAHGDLLEKFHILSGPILKNAQLFPRMFFDFFLN